MASKEIVWPEMKRGNIYEVTVYHPGLGSDFEIFGTFDKYENGNYFFQPNSFIKPLQFPYTVSKNEKAFPVPIAYIKNIVDTNDFSMFRSNMIAGKTRRCRNRNKKSKRRYKRKTGRS